MKKMKYNYEIEKFRDGDNCVTWKLATLNQQGDDVRLTLKVCNIGS